jgi:histone H1/5
VVEVEVDDDDDDEDTVDDEDTNDNDDDDDDDNGEQVEEVKSPPKNNKTPTKKTTNSTTPKKSSTPSSSSSTTKKTPASSSKNKTSYIQMVHDAIIAMKDRTGSSLVAIHKYIVAHHPEIDDNPRFKTRLRLTLKTGVSSSRLQKIKASYKIDPVFLKKNKKPKPKPKKVKPKKPPPPPPKPKVKKITKAELAAMKEKQERERKEKERQERIRKRKFPMDDMDLIQEDKELGVHVSLPPRPSLPLVMPAFSSACKSDTNLQGMCEDILHIYNFFRGDVGFGRHTRLGLQHVAPFSLSHWIHAVQQVLNGNAKKSRMVPPLFSHLFCVAMQHLLVQVDIPKLSVGLGASSWSEILLLYMDAMERYHTTEASLMKNVLPPNPIDVEYLLGGATDQPKDDWNVNVNTTTDTSTDTTGTTTNLDEPTPGPSYLTGVIKKAHYKLLYHDPWLLTAEDLLALLRALCDDLLANSPLLEQEMDNRLTEVHELQKKKRATDAHVRKLQTTMNREAAEEAKQEKSDDPPTRPTRSSTTLKSVTPAQLETAKRQQQRANDAYDKASRTRLLRTESVGEDRQVHKAYHFANDPSLVFFQQRGGIAKSTETWNVPWEFRTYKTSWHVIDKKSQLDSYVESLDVRGKREGALHEALTPFRRFLHDDVKELADQKARLREKKDLIRQLENAKIKAEVGRKSGRLAGRTEEELIILQAEIDALSETIEGKVGPGPPIDYESETGLSMLRQFDSDGAGGSKRRATRRDTKQQQVEAQQDDTLPKMPCSKLVSTGNIDGTGVVGIIVADLLELEERTQLLCDWEKKDRKAWIGALETLVHSWHTASPPVLENDSTVPESPKGDASRMSIGATPVGGSDAKRQKLLEMSGTASSSSSTPSTVSQMLFNLRVCTVPNEEHGTLERPILQLSGISHLTLFICCLFWVCLVFFYSHLCSNWKNAFLK